MNDVIEVRTALLGMGWKWAAAMPTDAAILARVYAGIRAAYLAMPESVNVDGGTRPQRRYSTAAAFDDAVTAFAAEQRATYGSLRLYRAMGDARARINAAACLLRRHAWLDADATRALARLGT